MNQTDEKIPDVLSMDNTAPSQPAETAQVEDAAQPSLQKEVEEIDSSGPAGKPDKPASKTTATREEQPPNPLLSDPYKWDVR